MVVGGITVISPQTIARAVSRFEGRCVGLAELNLILESVTFLYVDAGYVASRAYLPPQDLSDGILDIVIVEGTLESIVIDGEPGNHPARIQTAFPGMKGRPVNLRDIEQGLDQLNRLSSIDARMELQAGTRPGGSVLHVFTSRSLPVHLSLGSDNLGATTTGRYQSRLGLGFDNAFGINDQWTFSYQRSMERNPWRYSLDRPNADTVTAAFSVPYGYWTVALNAHWSQYRSDIEGALTTIETSGISRAVHADVRRVLHRDRISKTALSGRLGWKDSRNYILDSLVEVSSRTLATAGIELTHSSRFFDGLIVTSLEHQWGLDIWGAFDDDDAPAGSPKGQFSKWAFRLGMTGPLKAGDLRATFDWSLSAQWSLDPLFGSEQMSVGGYSTVRGVREARLFGNRAAIMRSELSLQSKPGEGVTAAVEPYIGLDCGVVLGQPAFGIEGGTLCGAAVGLRGRGGWFDLDLHYADTIATAKGSVLQVRVSISI